MTLYVGNIVQPTDPRVCTLTSGCKSYDYAVVTSTSPLILVSEEGDMIWRGTVHEQNYDLVAVADAPMLKLCIDRMNRELQQDEINKHNADLTKELFRKASDNVAKNDLEGFSRAVELMIQNRE